MQLLLIIITVSVFKSIIKALAGIRSDVSTKAKSLKSSTKKDVHSIQRKLIDKADKLTLEYELLKDKLSHTKSNDPKFTQYVTKLEYVDEERKKVYQDMLDTGMEI